MISNQIKISVIVPVYNAEKYLNECLNSILNQSLKEIEVICINDGSTDDSLKILKSYEKIDSRVIIIDQENLKQGTARNNGLKRASGEYVVFVDSDDYIDTDMLHFLYSKSSLLNLDMLSYGGINFDDETRELINNPYYNFQYLPNDWDQQVFNFKEGYHKFLSRMAVSAALTMYKREFLIKNNISFPDGLFFEDNVFFLKSVLNADRISIDTNKYYYRRIQPKSTTQNLGKHFSDYLKICDLVLEFITSRNDPSLFNIYKGTYLNSVLNKFNALNENENLIYRREAVHFFEKYGIDNRRVRKVTKTLFNLISLDKTDKKVIAKFMNNVFYESTKEYKTRNVKLFNFSIYKRIDTKEKKLYLLGIQVYRK